MKNFLSRFSFDMGSKFKGILCQQNIMFGIFSIFALLFVIILGKIFGGNVFAQIFIGLIMLAWLVMAIMCVINSDSTESIEIHQGPNKMIIKSPSKQLMPVIMRKLLENTARPNKLIPINVDPKDDPSKFQSLTNEQQDAIVKEEVKIALSGQVVTE